MPVNTCASSNSINFMKSSLIYSKDGHTLSFIEMIIWDNELDNKLCRASLPVRKSAQIATGFFTFKVLNGHKKQIYGQKYKKL